MCSSVKWVKAEGQRKTENKANALERELESLGLGLRHLHHLTCVPRGIQRHTNIYIPHGCPHLLGESKKEMMMKLCDPGNITRWGLQWRLTVLCRIERTTHRVRLIPQVPSYDSARLLFTWPLKVSLSCKRQGAGNVAQLLLMVITRGSTNGLQRGISSWESPESIYPGMVITTKLAKYSQPSLGLAHLQDFHNRWLID